MHALDLALAEGRRAAHPAEPAAVGLALELHRQQMLDAELGRDRGGDELVGRGDDRHQIAAALVMAHQLQRLGGHPGAQHLGQETLARGQGLGQRALTPHRGGEVDVGVEIERAGLVVGIEGIVAATELVGIGPADLDHEAAEGMVGVDRDQRVVQVEQAEMAGGCGHRFGSGKGRGALADPSTAQISSGSASICRSSASVTAFLFDSA